jgi:drug/metabolite transporter (DMT)-like permease
LQQKAKKISSTETILFLRSILAVPFLLLIAYMFRQNFQIHQVKESIWFLIFNGVIIFGFSKMLWIEGIARISVTKANALNSLAPLFTLFVAWLVLHQLPTIWQIVSLVPFFFGVLLLTNNLKFKNRLNTI